MIEKNDRRFRHGQGKDSSRKNVYGTTTKNEIVHIPKRSGCKWKTIEREYFVFFSSEEIGNKSYRIDYAVEGVVFSRVGE